MPSSTWYVLAFFTTRTAVALTSTGSLLNLRAGSELGAEAGLSALIAASGSGDSVAELPSFTPEFFAPELTPKQILIVSSPSLGKIAYTTLKNFKSKTGKVYVLIDSGLEQPCSLAVNAKLRQLFVADRGAQAIYRYSIQIERDFQDGVETYSVTTDGTRVTILSGHPVEWITLDSKGNLFYSSPDTNTVNMISTVLIDRLSEGMYTAESLTTVKSKQLQLDALIQAKLHPGGTTSNTTTAPPETGESILEIYDGSINPHVNTPTGLVADGLRLFFANSAAGTTNGLIIRGEVEPKIPPNATIDTPFPVLPLSSVSTGAMGVARTSGMVYFTTPGSMEGSVYGVVQDGGREAAVVSGLSEPRGLAWDGDNTMYVADEKDGTIWSFPAGQLRTSAPLTMTVMFQGAFGLALLSQVDNEELFVNVQKSASCIASSRVYASMVAVSFLAMVSSASAE